MSAARAAARLKPVLVLKAGRSRGGARAAASHTGVLAGSDAVYDAAFRRAGMLRVGTMAELFDAVETLALTGEQHGDRLAILTNGGGAGVLATDALAAHGGRLAELSPETIARLDGVLPPTWSRGNPVDIIGDAPGARYAAALEALFADDGVDACPGPELPDGARGAGRAARAVIERDGVAAAPRRGAAATCSPPGSARTSAAPARALFDAARIPTYDTPEHAVPAFLHRVRYQRNQALLMETPPARPDRTIADPRRCPSPRSPPPSRNADPGSIRPKLTPCSTPTASRARHSRLAADPDEAAAAAARSAFRSR